MSNISSNLKLLRNEANLTIEELSEKTGIKQELIIGFESGEYNPNEYQLEVLCKILKMPADEISERNLVEERKTATSKMRSKDNRENFNWYFGNRKRFLFYLGYVVYFVLGIVLLSLYYINKFERLELSFEVLESLWYEDPNLFYYAISYFIGYGFSIFGLGVSAFIVIDYFSKHYFYFRWWYIFWISIIITCLKYIGLFGSIPYFIYVIIKLIKRKY